MWVGRDRLPGGPRASWCYQNRSKYSISFKKPKSTAARQPALVPRRGISDQSRPPAVVDSPEKVDRAVPGAVRAVLEDQALCRARPTLGMDWRMSLGSEPSGAALR